jgi:hypothetical protein
MSDSIRISVVTSGEDLDDRFNTQQPLQVVFNRALQGVGGGSVRGQFILEHNGTSLDLERRIGQHVAERGWVDGVVLELVPRPEVI